MPPVTTAATRGDIGLSPAEQRDLLERHKPILCFDAYEPYFATRTDAFTRPRGDEVASRCYLMRQGEPRPYRDSGVPDGPGDLVERPAGDEASGWAYDDGTPWSAGDALTLAPAGVAPPDYRHDGALQQEALGPAVHGRVAADERPGHGWWLQYWFFYFGNDRFEPSSGPIWHEADWEMVQIHLPVDPGDPRRPAPAPTEVTYSQHEGAGARSWTRAERRGDRLLVYPGRGTHACYPRAVNWIFDRVDGRYEVDGADLVVMDDTTRWPEWPGRWGGGEGSPTGLGMRPQWDRPAQWHAGADGPVLSFVRNLLQARLRWLLGRLRIAGRRQVERVSGPTRAVLRGGVGTLRRTARRPVAVRAETGAEATSAAPQPSPSEIVFSRRRRVTARWDPAESGLARIDVEIRDFGLSLSINYLIVRISAAGRPPRVYTWDVEPGRPETGFRCTRQIPWRLADGVEYEIHAVGASVWGLDQAPLGGAVLAPR
jgi:hypothetical protein